MSSPPSLNLFSPFGEPARPLAGAVPGLSPCGWLVVLLLLPLIGAVLARQVAQRRPARLATLALFLMAATTNLLLLTRLGLGGGVAAAGELVQPLWRVLAVGRLGLDIGLCLDRSAAVLLGLWALLAGWAAAYGGRRAAGRLCLCAWGLALALLGDGLWLRLLGWEVMTLTGWALSVRRGAATLGLARGGDATLLLATALLFWALGGSWSSSRLDARYELDAPPAVAPAAVQAGPSLALHQLPTELHQSALPEPQRSAARAALADKLWPGGRVLTWLGVLFALAVALKVAAATLQLLGEWRVAAGTSLLLWAAAVFAGGHLLWRLR